MSRWLYLVLAFACVLGCSSKKLFDSGDAGDGGPGSNLPGLVSLAVTPPQTTLQLMWAMPVAPVTTMLTATGTFKDGTTRDVTSKVDWVATPSFASVGVGVFNSATAGLYTVSATSGSISATAKVTVKLSGDVVLGGVDKSKLDGNPTDAPPTVSYPIDGSLFPYKFAPLEFQMVPSVQGQSIGRVAFTGDAIDLRVYNTCNPIAQASISGACALDLPDPLAAQLAGASEADNMQEKVRLAKTDGTSLAESAPLDTRWASDPLKGAIYYWSAQFVGQGGKNLLLRFNLDTPGTAPEIYYSDDDTKNVYPAYTQYYQPCFGCHAISLDGKKIGLSYGGSVPAQFALLDVATKKPFGNAPMQQMTNPPNFSVRWGQDDQGFASATTFSPDGNTMVQEFRGQLFARSADANLMQIGGPLFTQTIDPLGEKITEPFWSPAGDQFVFASWVPPNGQKLTGDIITGSQIWIAPVNGTSFGTPKLLVPRVSGKTEYYPALSDDSKLVIFNESRCDGPPTPPADNWGFGPCDSYDDPSAKLRVVAGGGGTPIDLARASGTDTWSDSWPRFSPTHGTFHGKTLYWVAFSSRRPYGATLAGSNTVNRERQLWFAAVSLDANGNLGADPSFAPVWMPKQNDAGAVGQRGNHIPQWVTKSIPINPN